MKRRLPPLNALVAFEAAARHRSFKKAGDELCVTPSAISHQVRQLEEWLGLRLFERRAGAVEPTDAGARYLLETGVLFDRIERLCDDETNWRANAAAITLQTTDSFAARWLAPRLAAFEALCPDLSLRIITRDFRDSLREDEADVGVLFIADAPRDELADGDPKLLFAEEIFPVCSPQILPRGKSIELDDLRAFTLIHDDNVGVSWSQWIASAGGGAIDFARSSTRYNHAHLALQAAELGNGIALASNVLAGDALARGRLAAPFAHRVVTGRGYYLTQSSRGRMREACRPFVEWMLSQRPARAEA